MSFQRALPSILIATFVLSNLQIIFGAVYVNGADPYSGSPNYGDPDDYPDQPPTLVVRGNLGSGSPVPPRMNVVQPGIPRQYPTQPPPPPMQYVPQPPPMAYVPQPPPPRPLPPRAPVVTFGSIFTPMNILMFPITIFVFLANMACSLIFG